MGRQEDIQELLAEFSQVETMGQLNYLRKQAANLMTSSSSEEEFKTIQDGFKAARNRLERISWANRPTNWDEEKPRI